MTLCDRVKTVNEAFKTPFFKNQLTAWNGEKQMNRGVLQDYWNKEGEQFVAFWENTCNESHTKEAMVLAVIEEITESLAGAFIDTVCPELATLRITALQSIQQGDPTICPTAITVVNIIKFVNNQTENDSERFNRQEIEQIISDLKLEKGDFIIHSLLLVRSCVLLEFCISLWIMYSEMQEATQ